MNIIEKIDNLTVLDYMNPETISNAIQEAKQEIKLMALKQSTLLSENERLRSERVELVKYAIVRSISNPLEAYTRSSLEGEKYPQELITQFEKERQ